MLSYFPALIDVVSVGVSLSLNMRSFRDRSNRSIISQIAWISCQTNCESSSTGDASNNKVSVESSSSNTSRVFRTLCINNFNSVANIKIVRNLSYDSRNVVLPVSFSNELKVSLIGEVCETRSSDFSSSSAKVSPDS